MVPNEVESIIYWKKTEVKMGNKHWRIVLKLNLQTSSYFGLILN